MNTIISTSYLAPVEYFGILNHSKILYLDASENYQKRSFRNKMYLLGPNGKFYLTIPLKKGKNNSQKIKEVKISYEENWVMNHLKSIVSAYQSAPFFDYIYPEFSKILDNRYKYLYNLNLELMEWVFHFLDWPIQIIEQKEYLKQHVGMNDLRNQVLDSHYSKSYPQVFENRHGFVKNLSILDLLFCLGKESKLLLHSHNYRIIK